MNTRFSRPSALDDSPRWAETEQDVAQKLLLPASNDDAKHHGRLDALGNELLITIRRANASERFPTALVQRAALSGNWEYLAWALVGQALASSSNGWTQRPLMLARYARRLLQSEVEHPLTLFPHWVAARVEAGCLFACGNVDQGEVVLREALELAQRCDNSTLVARTLIELGNSARRSSDFLSAYDFNNEVIRSHFSPTCRTIAMHAIGDVFSEIGEVELAERYHSDARRSVDQLAPWPQSRARYRYARGQIRVGNLENARQEIDLALHVVRRHSPRLQVPVQITNAELLLEEHLHEQALAQVNAARETLATGDNQTHRAWAAAVKADALLRLDRAPEALDTLLRVPMQAMLNSELVRHYTLKTRVYSSLGEWQNAAECQKRRLNLLDAQHEHRGGILDVQRTQRQTTEPPQDRGLQTTIHELVEIRRDRDEVIDILVRDVRQPLVALDRTIRSLHQASPNGQSRVGSLREAGRTIQRIRAIAEHLATSGELDAGRIAVDLSPVDIWDLAQRVIDSEQSVATSRRVRCSLVVDPGLYAQADEELLFQILGDLVRTAIRFSPLGGIVRVAARRSADGAVILQVTDSGNSLTAADRTALFDRHAPRWPGRSERSLTSNFGLYVSGQLVSTMGASIAALTHVDSVGNTFELVLDPANVASQSPDEHALN